MAVADVTFNSDDTRATMLRVAERLARTDGYMEQADAGIGPWTPDDLMLLVSLMGGTVETTRAVLQRIWLAEPVMVGVLTKVLMQLGYAMALADRAAEK